MPRGRRDGKKEEVEREEEEGRVGGAEDGEADGLESSVAMELETPGYTRSRGGLGSSVCIPRLTLFRPQTGSWNHRAVHRPCATGLPYDSNRGHKISNER